MSSARELLNIIHVIFIITINVSLRVM